MRRVVRSLVAGAFIAAAPSQAWAFCIATGVFGSAVHAGPSAWTYTFTVANGCNGAGGLMTDFFLPYFPDAGIRDIVFPGPDATTFPGNTITWTTSIDAANNLFGLAGAGVIDFHVTVSPELVVGPGDHTAPGVGLYHANVGFTADFDGVEGPAAIERTPFAGGAYTGTEVLFFDPPIPASPMTLGALGATATPEPGSLMLLATGLFALAIPVARRRGAPVA